MAIESDDRRFRGPSSTIAGDSAGQARRTRVTGHDGVFAVSPEHVDEYVTRYSPLCVRYNANCCKSLDLPFMNIGIVKGLSVPPSPDRPHRWHARLSTQGKADG